MVRIYLFRHGIAENYNSAGDAGRQLTSKGRKKVAVMANFLKKRVSPKMIISSPYTRAMETAQIAAKEVGIDPEYIKTSDVLFPGSDYHETLIELNALDCHDVMLFGHNMHMSDLLCGSIGMKGSYIKMKKSAVACIDFPVTVEPGSGNLKWLVTPAFIDP